MLSGIKFKHMKNTKIMKNLYMLLIVFVAILLMPNLVQAQENENEIKIKLVKEKDGDRTVLDTTIIISSNKIESLEEIEELLKDEGFEDFDILIDDIGEVNVKGMHIDGDEDGFETIVVIKHMEGEGDEAEKEYIVTIIKTDSVVGGKVMKMHVGESGYGYFISDDDDVPPDEAVVQTAMKRSVAGMLDIHDQRERTIIQLFFGINTDRRHTLAEIGRTMGISRERVRQLKNRAISKLNDKTDSKNLLLYLK